MLKSNTKKKIFKGDLIVINIKKKKAKEIMGLGNVQVKEKKNVHAGR